jgi:hypothetical protein
MDLVDEFRRHVAECRQAARMARTQADRADWDLLAERWQRCVQTAESALAAAANADHSRTRRMRRLSGSRGRPEAAPTQ